MAAAIHLISIGGRGLHALALALRQAGITVTGSDSQIPEPVLAKLQQQRIAPDALGWFPERITPTLSAVIVGSQTAPDNPEWLRANELGVPIYSFAEFIYHFCQEKQRVVITGSHGKTTIVAMLLHVLQYFNRSFDYVVGTPPEGFTERIRLSEYAPLIIIEGEEYVSSAIDSRPRFLHYQPHIALISGIAWDHVNLYPSWELYVDQFEILADSMPKGGILAFDESDNMLDIIGQKERPDVSKIPYQAHPSEVVNGQTFLLTGSGGRMPVAIFGDYNLKNLAGAMAICDRIGIPDSAFYEAISNFQGTALPLELLGEKQEHRIFRDSAQVPSRIAAITTAIKAQYPDQSLLVVVDLPNASRTNRDFLKQYADCMQSADLAAVYIGATDFSGDEIRQLIQVPAVEVFDQLADLQTYLLSEMPRIGNLLLLGTDLPSKLSLDQLIDAIPQS